MQQTVRPLELGDVGDIAALESMARYALLEQRGGPALLAEQPAVGDWAALVAHPVERVWLAMIDDVPVGYLQSAIVAGGAAEVLQVFVHPEARELGFGDWLLEAALQAARDAGSTVLEGTALPGDRDTKNLYERAGIKARKITVSLPL
ncbi:MAG: GNAT family N-acetyltransferase [Ilumatobacteraceae bacterium]